jgi:ABC-type sugar transport system substrate-binding protein
VTAYGHADMSTIPRRGGRRMSKALSTRRRAQFALVVCAAATSLLISACSGGPGGGGREEIGVTLITKDSSNPFAIAMQEGAKQAASEEDVKLTIGAGAFDGDDQGQVRQLENAISEGQKGILIAANGSAVNRAIKRARDAGLFVIALDTPTEPADAANLTLGTDSFKAGELIGHWAAETLAGQPATIAMLEVDDKIASVDVRRDQGFFTGMGIDVKDNEKIGDEAPTGSYRGGGTYEIVCHQAAQGSLNGGRAAMESCLSKSPGIDLVYAANESAAEGAHQALRAAGHAGATIVSVGGGCEPGIRLVKEGVVGATSQLYPLKMASEGVKALVQFVKTGRGPELASETQFIDAGVALVTDKPVAGVESITSAEADKSCWG